MRFTLLPIALLLTILHLNGQPSPPLFPNLQGNDLLQALQNRYTPGQVLGYGPARDLMYGEIDNFQDTVYGIYSGHKLYLPPGEDPSQALYQNGSADGINCEHVWPRSKGAKSGHAKSDMHHLFPTRLAVNASRGNAPFAEIPDELTEHWYFEDQERSGIPERLIDAYSESTGAQFEPREDRKGDIARAMFYFYTIYRQEALQADPLFFQIQRETLLLWHQLDPADEREIDRTQAIARYQDGKPNPFVLDPGLAERLYATD
ncbi:MAG: endonuclease [Phaeodactylibacter sp.]|uniref:endonuclease I family protein n=1 Tax=Phaeodactylibacter sp. TaxID=1940289 RepID=UPI0032EF0358